MGKELWPLVVLFGSYRGNGEKVLKEIAKYLRGQHIRAYIVKEMEKQFPRKPNITDDQYNYELSMYAVEKCDIAVFLFLRARLLGVEDNLEAFDQGVVLEFQKFCQRLEHKKENEKSIKKCVLIFDSLTRYRGASSLLRGLTQRATKYVAQRIIEVKPNASLSEILSEMKEEIYGYCLAQYAEYAKAVKRYAFPQFLAALHEDP